MTVATEMKKWYALAIGIRLVLVLYGEWQDRNMLVKYTDVDYFVFSDAAAFVAKGESPYQRSTFRYTPLLAWALTPNVYLSPLFGKVVFIIFDILVGHLIFSILKCNLYTDRTSKIAALSWLLNPLPMAVSSRGNAESIMAYLVLQTISLLQSRHTALAGLMYALSVHVKIYPVTYAPTIYMFLRCEHLMDEAEITKTHWTHIRSFLLSLRPTWNHIKFGSIAGITLGLLTYGFYLSYGWVFLYETYLYHIVRKDIRHNFSPYFYMLYLTANDDETAAVVKLISFLPQILLLVAIALRFPGDLPLCCFLCTFTFVMLNKVCTSQYFLWYLCLLPLLGPRLHISWVKGAIVATLWFLAQGIWLLPAYYLEFEGQNTFLVVWMAGLFFFLVNVYIVFVVISHYNYNSMKMISKKE